MAIPTSETLEMTSKTEVKKDKPAENSLIIYLLIIFIPFSEAGDEKYEAV